MNFFQLVYALVRQIPTGYVTTYGDLARALGTRDLPAGRQVLAARTVGWALHANKDPLTPCHRVVTKDGRLSESYAFGGSIEQYAKLVGEGVTFYDRTHVDLSRHRFRYSQPPAFVIRSHQSSNFDSLQLIPVIQSTLNHCVPRLSKYS